MAELFFLFPHFSAKQNSLLKILTHRLDLPDLRAAGEDSGLRRAREQHWERGREELSRGYRECCPTWELTMKIKAEFQSPLTIMSCECQHEAQEKWTQFMTKQGSSGRASGKVHQELCVTWMWKNIHSAKCPCQRIALTRNTGRHAYSLLLLTYGVLISIKTFHLLKPGFSAFCQDLTNSFSCNYHQLQHWIKHHDIIWKSYAGRTENEIFISYAYYGSPSTYLPQYVPTRIAQTFSLTWPEAVFQLESCFNYFP